MYIYVSHSPCATTLYRKAKRAGQEGTTKRAKSYSLAFNLYARRDGEIRQPREQQEYKWPSFMSSHGYSSARIILIRKPRLYRSHH
jgi:hypothetical protein